MKVQKYSSWVFFTGIILLFLVGCAISVATPLSPTTTSLPPIPTPIPPTSTSAPCPRIAPISDKVTILKPFKAATQDKIRYGGAAFTSYVKTNSSSDTFLVVYFEGVRVDSTIAFEDLDWIVIDSKCNQLRSIGFGLPATEGIVMYGQFGPGTSLDRFEISSNKPLIGMVFVIPREMVNVTLWDPQRKEYRVSVIEGWLPQKENYFGAYFVNGALGRKNKGENWTSSR